MFKNLTVIILKKKSLKKDIPFVSNYPSVGLSCRKELV